MVYNDCQNTTIATSYGNTYTHICGNKKSKSKPVILFFHGIGSVSMLFADWLVPALQDKYTCLAMDYPCDTGRSSPPNGDVKKCPQTKEQLVWWVAEIIDGFQLTGRKVSVVGYSFGAYIAGSVAKLRPNLVENVVLLAPYGIFTPVPMSWVFRAIITGMMKMEAVDEWFLDSMSVKGFRISDLPLGAPEWLAATRALGATVVSIFPDVWRDEELKQINAQTSSTLLLIGENETVSNGTEAHERAQAAGWKSTLYHNAGHLMFMEEPTRSKIIKDVVSFFGV
eukprot:CAMPEP_0116822254 /NCGR_PEP_ID=MMETSP0418-20121206/167_1 /TAXON_ID=1158023 /ORGANISM="Astrosyne radiata, Strain 13vi08-1A" /LENGTH=281 /DNA_ID=CAMNT_0004450349 /DNA_START=165 /DNA_END=1010 /DNA_ORIENTATION=+